MLAGLTGAYKEENTNLERICPGLKVPGSAGKVDDGFGVLLKTLEDFPYSRFGLNI